MNNFIRRAMAGLLLATLVLTSIPTVHIHAEEAGHVHAEEAVVTSLLTITEEELAGGKVLMVTADMLDANGNLLITGEGWERIIVTREVNAKKVTLQNVTAKVLAIESGIAGSFDVNASIIGTIAIVSPQLEVIGYDEICEMLASGMDAAEVAETYNTYLAEKEAVEEIVPNVMIRGESEITSIQVTGNGKLDVSAAKVAGIQISNSSVQNRTAVTVQGYNGAVAVTQEDGTDGVYSILNLNLKNSELTALTVAGSEKSACMIEGTKDSVIKQMSLTGASQVTLNVVTTEVLMEADAENASLNIYADVENVVVEGNNNKLKVAASAKVENAVVNGDNVKVSLNGEITNSTVSGTGSKVTRVPVAGGFTGSTGSGSSKPSTPVEPGEPDTPDIPDTPDEPIIPDDPDNPDNPDNPDDPVDPDDPLDPDDSEEEKAHVHSWNVKAATCVTAKYCTDETCGYIEEAATGIHTFTEESEVKEPTCTEGGYTVYQCQYCEETEISDIIAQAGHKVDSWSVGALAEGETCIYTQVGICTDCEETLVSETTVEKHSTNLTFKVTKEATCQTEGEKTYTCPDCGEVISKETYANPDAHSWDSGKQEGIKTVYSCTVSGCTAMKSVVSMTTEGVSGSALDVDTQVETDSGVVMSFDSSVLSQINNSATDTASGAALKLSAEVLDDSAKEEATANMSAEDKEQLGNNEIYDFSMLIDDEQVSDFDGSVTVRIPYTISEDEDPNEIAVWYLADDGTVEGVKGKYHDGFVTFETTHFSYYTVVRLAPEARCKLFGHLWLSSETNPTCTEDGYITSICQRCEETKVTPGQKATGHNLEESVIEEATCQHKGKHRYECNNKHCEFYTEVETSKSKHKDKEVGRKEATCAEAGYIEYSCKEKGCEYIRREELPATGHVTGEDGKCTICGVDASCKHNRKQVLLALAEGSTNCEDGVICTQICLECESILDEWTVNEHTTGILELINQYPYGDNCDGYVALRGCACGEVDAWFTRSILNSAAWTNNSYRETDAQGIEWRVNEYICDADSVVIMRRYHDEPIEGETCLVLRDTTYTLYVDGVEQESIQAVIRQEVHSTVCYAELAEGSTTCEDGIICTDYCLDCKKEIGTWESTYHEYAVKELIDLSKYEGFCGGYITIHGCPCGYDGGMNYQNYSECSFSSSGKSYQDENGNWIYLRNYICNECGSMVNDEYTMTELEGCRAIREGVLTIYENGEAAESFAYSFEQEYHDTYQKAELAEGSESCLDGILIENYCRDCEQMLNSWTNYGHYNVEVKTIDLSKYDGLCEGTIIFRACPCGENHSWSRSLSCNFSNSYESYADETGMEHEVNTYTCQSCDFKYTRDVVVAKNEDCTAVTSYDYKFYISEELIDAYAYTALEDNHDSYFTEGTLVEGVTSCEDGVMATQKCYNCDYEWTGIWYGHMGIVKDELDLAEYGVACGGYIRVYECACGSSKYDSAEFSCDTGYNWNDVKYNYYTDEEVVDGTTIYSKELACAVTDPKCTLHIRMEKHHTYNEAECMMEEQIIFYGDAAGDGVYEMEIVLYDGSWSEHQNLGDEVITYETVEDGTALEVHTRTCTGCGEYKDINVYADYLGDESYCYHIRNAWGIEGESMDYWDYEYTFTEKGCSYTEIYSNSNGYYEERETKPGCITDNFTENRTCADYAHGVCKLCGNENPLNPRMYGNPMNHNFAMKESGDGYYCTRCDLESENGVSGQIVLRDASDEESFIADYWNKEELVVEIFVILVTENEDILTDLTVTNQSTFDVGTASISKAEVAAWAAENGVAGSYDAMFSFIPKNASVDTAYNITFTPKHTWAYKTELLSGSISCNDGVLVTEYCLDCGELGGSWNSTEHVQAVTAMLDLSEYSNTCGGYVLVTECACGENSSMTTKHAECNFSYQGYSSVEVDGTWMNCQNYICNTCSIKLVYESYVEDKGNCKGVETGAMKLYEGETEIASEDYTRTVDVHSSKVIVKLAAGSITCEDGVIASSTCWRCGITLNSGWTETTHYAGVKESIDWYSVENTCGGYVAVYECACGQENRLSFNRNCEFTYSGENVTGEDGIMHFIQTATCQNCSISYTEDQVSVQDEDCTANVTNTIKVYADDTLLGELTYNSVQESHEQYTSAVTLLTEGTTCLEGVARTLKCRNCDWSGEGISYYHETAEMGPFNLNDYGAACGSSVTVYECACGGSDMCTVNANLICNTGLSWNAMWSNGYGEEQTTEEGVIAYAEHTCPDCGYTYKFKRVDCSDETMTKYTCYLLLGDEEFRVGMYGY